MLIKIVEMFQFYVRPHKAITMKFLLVLLSVITLKCLVNSQTLIATLPNLVIYNKISNPTSNQILIYLILKSLEFSYIRSVKSAVLKSLRLRTFTNQVTVRCLTPIDLHFICRLSNHFNSRYLKLIF